MGQVLLPLSLRFRKPKSIGNNFKTYIRKSHEEGKENYFEDGSSTVKDTNDGNFKNKKAQNIFFLLVNNFPASNFEKKKIRIFSFFIGQ